MAKNAKKVFVLDTNVILHDSSCIHHFEDNDIVLPITVIEELDHFKKGNDSLNFHAREFVRTLDGLSGDKLFDGGAHIGPGLGKVMVRLEQPIHPEIALSFSTNKPDHQILNISYGLAKENPKRQVILITKDVNLRMKAKSIGLVSQNYTKDQVQDVSSLYKGRRTEEHMPDEVVEAMYKPPFELAVEDVPFSTPPAPNEFFILRNHRKSALATFDPFSQTIKRVDKSPAYGIMPRNSEQTFALNALLNDQVKLVTISGKAGTGKTLLALAAALESRRHYRQIYMARPVVPLSNKDIGYLPGDINSKLDPYMQPLHDNLGVIQNQFTEADSKHQKIRALLDEQKLVIAALSYIRGRSLVKICFIVDEAQNLTPHEVKTIITRAGEGTKIIFTGDIFQIDHPYLDSHSNGLSYLIEKMQGQKIYAHVTLERGERSELAELASDLL